MSRLRPLPVAAVILVTVASLQASGASPAGGGARAGSPSSTAARSTTVLVTTGTTHAFQPETGDYEVVTFTCDVLALGADVRRTGVIGCYVRGRIFKDEHRVPGLPIYRPGWEATAAMAFWGRTQGYDLCKKGAWIDKGGNRYVGEATCERLTMRVR